MRELLSGALPAPQDEPQQRDVIDAAMDWGMRRRRRDWVLSAAAALAVIAVGTGVAAMSGGSGNEVSSASGRQPSASSSGPNFPAGSGWTSSCNAPGTAKGDLVRICQLYSEQQNFMTDFAKGSAPYIQAALPDGFTVQTTATSVLILTGPNGETNYLLASTESASTRDGRPLSCGPPSQVGCLQTSIAGGTVVVDSYPSGDPSAGYVGAGLKDPRVDILLHTSAGGGMDGVAPPTSAVPLLSNLQLEKILIDPGLLAYAKAQLQHQNDIMHQLGSLLPPSESGSSYSSAPKASPSGSQSSGATGSWSPPSTPKTPGSRSSSQSQPSDTQSSGFSQPPGSSVSSPGSSSVSSPVSSPGIPVSSGS
ncbi:hypothetical protein Caci_8735 [Catenulispora acidiphila DSM 44928]|uniref:Uncharacterized protein n=2 Tax=Catenulispora TaxID=414878 RepID=C7Q213_CATAD|nr:hypothetical protein Caci_8735 [Catenulispora acidiphila DSM 44928]